ncbi:MAG: AAA domain-containing protein [Candidatus Anammoxibacter sp.]
MMSSNFGDPPPTLPPLLDEFRRALQDEIEVAKRNASSSAIPLTNGHKVGEQGSAHQYAFIIDSVLNTPDGAPGDLIVPGKAPMEATIVSVDGFRIVISVEFDFGKFVPSARLQTNLTILMRKLIQRIEDNAIAQNFAANRMLGNTGVTGSLTSTNDKPNLNESQLNALKSSLGCNLTFIWGPPGTGKTYTIGTITEYLHKASRSVLLVSHTNTAVDQAIKHVASSLKEQLHKGVVVRVGEVKDTVLQSDYPDVLLKTQVERKSRELVEEKRKCSEKRQRLSDEMFATQKDISIIEWLKFAKQEIDSIGKITVEITKLQQLEQEATKELVELKEQHTRLLELHERTARILALNKQLTLKQAEQISMQSEFKAVSTEQEQIVKKITEQEDRILIATRITPLRMELATYPSPTEQKTNISSLSSSIIEKGKELATVQDDFTQAEVLLDTTQNTKAIWRLLKRLPKPDAQQKVINGLSEQLMTVGAELSAAKQAHDSATVKLARIIEMDGELSRHETIGTCSQEQELKTQAERRLKQIKIKKEKLVEELKLLQSHIQQIESEADQLSQTINGNVQDVYKEVCSQLQKHNELQGSIALIKKQTGELENKNKALLPSLATSLKEWGELEEIPSSTHVTYGVVFRVHSELTIRYASANQESLLKKVLSLRSSIQSIDTEIAEIDAKLTKVEHEVINDAAVIGTTLTKAYLSDVIQGRKFDTVILDEASMAPIPALWAAALLSDNNLIIVGDFKQLPPIVLSNNELTKKWLGRDIFEVSGVKEKWNNGNPPSNFIQLVEQRRMLPELADVASNLFYDGKLKNGPIDATKCEDFLGWYTKDWPHDNPVVLVDIGPLNAWVTSVVKGGNSSRLNFLSATISVDIAERLLSADRPQRKEGASKRILIISPYRAHAKLVNILLSDFTQLQNEVIAGTAHSFQGSEADVVIFDMVADEPHWKVNLFMDKNDAHLKSLFNVGLTRAKFRLFILGDFDYCQKLGKKAFLGKTLIPFMLEKFPRINAMEIIPDGLAARAAKAQMTMRGGKIGPNSERIVVTQVDFYRFLSSDLLNSVNRVIIYSPFITQNRLGELMPQLQAAIERGVVIYVITKALSERSKSELSQIKDIEAQLSKIGIIVIHKLRMHEKLVFIDDDIIWSGSLNPLSFLNTQEIMERRKSKDVLRDYSKILRIEELLGVQGKPEAFCPICNAAMIAAEGADQPFYWRCTKDECYTRSIEQPYPLDGVLTCGTCNSSVEYGSWGDKPHWRCTKNNRHRQRIFKSHLRLPKMASLVPRGEQKKLCKLLGIDNFGDHVLNSELKRNKKPEQLNLFD